MIQQRYGRLPFSEFLEELGQRPVEERDLTVAELVAFVCEQRRPDPRGGVTVAPTLLIGLDGATWTILDPYMERGVMPFLRDLCARGTRAPLRSIVPALTPPAWTSLMTGKRPGGHGVFDFFQKDDAGQRSTSASRARRTCTARRSGRSRATPGSASSRSTSR